MRVRTTVEASLLLRPGLLEGVSVLLAGPAAAGSSAWSGATDSLADAVAAACLALGAEVAAWEAAGEVGVVDVLVVDGAGMFASGCAEGTAGRTAQSMMPASSLGACLEGAWEATGEVVNGAFLAAGRGGRIVYLAPAPDAGLHAEAARAGLENLSRTLSIEWARHAVTAVTLAPAAGSSAGEVATLVAYLASPAGAYFSGCLLDLRGPSPGRL
jgi:NAD(P)-dependent dehydrogenase (short-subunit alcohol dehydrogenase family)